MRFKDKIVVVTGSGKGIGRANAIDFAREGAKIVLVSRTLKDLEEVSLIINKIGSDSLIVRADVSREEDVKEIFEKALEKYKTVDILVNNAAIVIRKSILAMSLEEWKKQLDINLTGTFLCMREALKIMAKNNYGKIVIVSSEAGKKGCSMKCAYSSSKFGQLGLTESAAADIKSKGLNININAVCPSGVDTPLTRKNYPKIDYSKAGFMNPGDISKVILFLASEEAKNLKGNSIEVYDGQFLNIDPFSD